jgi:hydroxymethylbilane synthase
MIKTIRIGTRESKLALMQVELVIKSFAEVINIADFKFEIVTIKTTGDIIQDKSLSEIGGKSLFTKEIELALLNDEIDIAVHSLKDFTYKVVEGTVISSYLKRGDPRDALISNKYKQISEISNTDIIGTSSSRRKSQLLYNNQNLIVKPLRGNVLTRLKKIENLEYDLGILAMSGLKRLSINSNIVNAIPLEEMLPAPGQGVICIQCKEKNDDIYNLTRLINDKITEISSITERGYVEGLEANCNTPIAAYCHVLEDKVILEAEIYSLDGKIKHKNTSSAAISDSFNLGFRTGVNFKKYIGI